jgi:uncharacterized protein
MYTPATGQKMKKEELKTDDEWKKLVSDTLEVQVTPKSSSNRIKAEIQNGALRLKVYVTAAPENDKANKAVIELLAKALNFPRSSLTIISGHHNRKKVIRISK